MANSKSQDRRQILLPSSGGGFTLIELIIYLAIVSIILVSISYLIIDIIAGQTGSNAEQEVNYNARFISQSLSRDIRAAQDASVSADTLILTMVGDVLIYRFDYLTKKLTRQVGLVSPVSWQSDEVEVTGSFTDLSYLGRTKNINVELMVNYKNPGNLPDYNASTTLNFAVELRGRR